MTGRGAGAGAAALARGDEDHVGALKRFLDLRAVLLGGLEAHVGVGAGAEALRQVHADVDLVVRVRHQQRLRVGVDGDELDALDAGFDHAVDGVGAAAAGADDLDDGEVVGSGLEHGSLQVRLPPRPSGARPLVFTTLKCSFMVVS